MIANSELTEEGMNKFHYFLAGISRIEIHSSTEFLNLSIDQRKRNIIIYPEKSIALWCCYNENNECIRKWKSHIPKNKEEKFIWESIEKI